MKTFVFLCAFGALASATLDGNGGSGLFGQKQPTQSVPIRVVVKPQPSNAPPMEQTVTIEETLGLALPNKNPSPEQTNPQLNPASLLDSLKKQQQLPAEPAPGILIQNTNQVVNKPTVIRTSPVKHLIPVLPAKETPEKMTKTTISGAITEVAEKKAQRPKPPTSSVLIAPQPVIEVEPFVVKPAPIPIPVKPYPLSVRPPSGVELVKPNCPAIPIVPSDPNPEYPGTPIPSAGVVLVKVDCLIPPVLEPVEDPFGAASPIRPMIPAPPAPASPITPVKPAPASPTAQVVPVPASPITSVAPPPASPVTVVVPAPASPITPVEPAPVAPASPITQFV